MKVVAKKAAGWWIWRYKLNFCSDFCTARPKFAPKFAPELQAFAPTFAALFDKHIAGTYKKISYRLINPTAFAMGFSLFIRSRIYSLAEESWNAQRAIGTAAGYWNAAGFLACSLALLEHRIAATRVCVCDGNAMRVRWTCDDFELRCKITAKNWIKKR